MTDPEDWRYHLVRTFHLPRFFANTSMTGLSGAYAVFCVASPGYRALFVGKGAPADRIVVTGIPNFDDAASFVGNDFPHRGYVLGVTSCLRETLKPEDRRGFIRRCLAVAGGRELLFKLHPNEDWERARREILELAPRATVFAEGNTNHMVANADVVVTKYSSVVYVALALQKEVHADVDLATLRELLPSRTAALPPAASRTYAGSCSAERRGPAFPHGAACRGRSRLGRSPSPPEPPDARRPAPRRPAQRRGERDGDGAPGGARSRRRPRPGPRAVLVCNPTALHVPTALAAARAGAHLFLEKPLSHDLEGVADLVEEVRARDLVVLVGFQYRFHPGLRRIREWLLAGEVGEVVSARRRGASTCRAGIPARTTGGATARAATSGGAPSRRSPTPSTTCAGCSARSRPCPRR